MLADTLCDSRFSVDHIIPFIKHDIRAPDKCCILAMIPVLLNRAAKCVPNGPTSLDGYLAKVEVVAADEKWQVFHQV